jgi:LysW-gamma-L-lysine carboxypeptidase
MICAAAQLDPTGAQIIVIGAVEEETPGSRGAHYIRERYMPDAVVIGEPSGWSGVTLGYKGRIGIHYDVQRPLSHMAGSGEKATEVAVTFWNQLTAYFDGLGDDQGLFRRATAVLGAFAGNIERAHLDISCRVPPGFDFDRLDAFLATIRQDARIDIDERTPAVLMDRSSPTARALTRSIRLHSGRPVFKLKTGTSDMNVVAQRWQVPMVAYGPGDSNLDHTPGEHLDFNEYHSAIAVLGDALSFLIAELRESRTDPIYSEDEEAEVLRRLADLGYL